MEEFKYLSDEDLLKLTSKERREYLKAKREWENRTLFQATLDSATSISTEKPQKASAVEPKPKPSVSEKKGETVAAEKTKSVTRINVDPDRKYSPYYDPKPAVGSRGGLLGRRPVDDSDRKKPLSLSCTASQVEIFKEAAKRERRSLSDLICLAVEEYIENHNLK